MQIFCDFDGTISIQNATDWILRHVADPAWELIEDAWKRGAIGSAECMQGQMALIRASWRSSAVGVDDFVWRILARRKLGCLATPFEASYSASKKYELFLAGGRYA